MLYLFEDFTLDTDKRELRRADVLVSLEPQVFDLLALLIRFRDRVVSRDEMIDGVWQGRIVSESTLSSRINAARTAIGDSGEVQRLRCGDQQKEIGQGQVHADEEACRHRADQRAQPQEHHADADAPGACVGGIDLGLDRDIAELQPGDAKAGDQHRTQNQRER